MSGALAARPSREGPAPAARPLPRACAAGRLPAGAAPSAVCGFGAEIGSQKCHPPAFPVSVRIVLVPGAPGHPVGILGWVVFLFPRETGPGFRERRCCACGSGGWRRRRHSTQPPAVPRTPSGPCPCPCPRCCGRGLRGLLAALPRAAPHVLLRFRGAVDPVSTGELGGSACPQTGGCGGTERGSSGQGCGSGVPQL